LNEDGQYALPPEKLPELIPSGVGGYDAAGTEINRVYLSDGYYRTLGFPRRERREFEGVNAVRAFRPEDVPGLLAEARASIREGLERFSASPAGWWPL
jgi:hypothetical protein